MNRPSESILPLKANSSSIQQEFPKTRKIDASIRKKYTTPTRERLIYDLFLVFCVLFLLLLRKFFQNFLSMKPFRALKACHLPVFVGVPETPGLRKIDQRSKGWTGRGLLVFRLNMY